MIDRRRFLHAACGCAAFSLAGCSNRELPDGPAEIKWDRDTCARCSMVISDRRFAAQARGPKGEVLKFDDIGCAVFRLRDLGSDPAAIRIWVADALSRADGVRWLDASAAHFVGGKVSPMGYNFAAVERAQPGTLDFVTMREHVLARGR